MGQPSRREHFHRLCPHKHRSRHHQRHGRLVESAARMRRCPRRRGSHVVEQRAGLALRGIRRGSVLPGHASPSPAPPSPAQPSPVPALPPRRAGPLLQFSFSSSTGTCRAEGECSGPSTPLILNTDSAPPSQRKILLLFLGKQLPRLHAST